MRRATWLVIVLAVAAAIAAAGSRWRAGRGAPSPALAGRIELDTWPAYAGRAACLECHETQGERWAGSHHDLAMQAATEATVLGDFDGATLTHFGVTSTFSRRDGRFLVRTDGPDGELHDHEVSYTFGVEPLQQYLVALPGGRLQVLPLCWDSRPAEAGGRRWFHIHPDEPIPPGDALHWTARSQNWNFMCAECHSTDLRKGYDRTRDVYETTWSEIDVSCEACHGPGSEHVARARRGETGAAGLVVRFREQGGWVMDMETGTARRTVPRASRVEIETCARCHARRSVIRGDYVHGRPLADTHRPRLLDDPLYFADGQIRDEVYVYGSFLQSRMYAAGVTCTDCHDPHRLDLVAPGNELCARCHLPDRFDTSAHHFHDASGSGGRCVECHMPARTYMAVDPRRDHSLRVPRPDLTVTLGTPNACNGCHPDRSAQWAADAVTAWYGPDRPRHWGEVLHAGRQGAPGAQRSLAALAGDPEAPAIVRATAVSLLAVPAPADAVRGALGDADPLVRAAGLGVLRGSPDLARLGGPLLDDPVRLVRVTAARVLAPVAARLDDAAAFDRAAVEYVESELANAERPESHVNLGSFYADQGRFAEAEASYRTALRLDERFVPASVNLADLYRELDRDAEGERVLRAALALEPGSAVAHHALGLLLVRRRQIPQALEALEHAARLAPDRPRYAYVHAVALHETGRTAEALRELETAHARHPHDPDILAALVAYHRAAGDVDAARVFARKLAALAPDDPAVRALLEELRIGGGG